MPSDLSERCRDARARIPVPAAPIGAITVAAAATPSRRSRVWPAFGFAAVSLVAAAVGAQVLGGTRLWFGPSGAVAMRFDQRAAYVVPTAANLRSVVAHAGFRVVLPAGLPDGSALNQLGTVGRSIVIVGYSVPAGPKRRHDVVLLLVDRAHVGRIAPGARNTIYAADVKGTGARAHWRAGDEDVLVLARGPLTAAQLQHVESATVARARRIR